MTRIRWAGMAGVLLIVLGSSQFWPARGADPRVEFFQKPRVVKLDITIAPKDLDSLRKEPRTYAKAQIKEDGVTTYKDVGIRLRGSVGSFRNVDDKPGLTLNMDKFADGQLFHGMDKFHLHNSAQDPTYIQELLCGDLFRAAGVPAARISHALVTINGRKLGMYYIKEGYDKGFLREYFGNPDGNFYDGGFLRDIDQPLELSSGKNDVKDRADLKALLAAAQTGDQAKRFEKLEKLLELDRFLALIAIEVITWDWDGYPLKPNNYRVYHHPQTNKITFIPSGMDQMWSDPNGTIFPGMGGVVARGVMETKTGKEKYVQKLTEVMDKVYKPEVLLKRIDEVEAVVKPALASHDAGAGKDYPNQLRRLREVIPYRAKNVTEQLKQQAKKK